MKNHLKNSVLKAAGVLALGSFGLCPLMADTTVPVAYKMPVHVNCNVNETGCNNNPGPTITIDGAISIGGLGANLILQNNLKGTKAATFTQWATNVSLVPLGGKITIPKQPVLGGVGGNPYIYMQFYDAKGNALSEEAFLGRCVQGLALGADFLNDVIGSTTVHSDGCLNHPGPVITMSGEIILSGLKARLIFRNNVKGTHTAETYSDVDIIIDGTPLVIPKQPSQGGAGGNPLILLQFLQGDGTPINDPVLLGRCNKL